MEVKIGVHNAPRELALETSKSPEEIDSLVQQALAEPQGVLNLTDERGRQIIVRTEHVTYVEIGEPVERRVGFGTA